MRYRPDPPQYDTSASESMASAIASSSDSIIEATHPEESASFRFECLLNELIEQNPRDIALASMKTLTSILSNIISFPRDSKYRVIKLTNKAIQSKILEVHGALKILHSIGFMKEGGESLQLPMSTRIMEYSELIMVLNKSTMQLEIDLQAAEKLTLDSSRAKPAADFDPFKPSIFRAAVQPRGGKSETEERLAALQEKQRSIEGEIPSDLESFRNTQVTKELRNKPC